MNSPTATPSDEELVSLYLKGDLSSFRQLYDRHKRGIFFLVKRYIKDDAKAEEVFQDIFMKVVSKIENYQASGSFKAWLYTVSRNYCIDKIRSFSRKKEINESTLQGTKQDEETQNNILDQFTQEESPQEEQSYQQEIAKKLSDALNLLPEEQKEVFLLKESSGFTFEEIAKITQVSVNTAKSRMRYALATLKRTLKNRDFVKEALE